jgi:hypothetical protein
MRRVLARFSPLRAGGYFSQKRLPADVQGEYARLNGVRAEDCFSIPLGTALPKARQPGLEFQAEVESRIANGFCRRMSTCRRAQATLRTSMPHGNMMKRRRDRE